ncbi:DUF655 domain-containing protein [Acidilobus sp.]|jgi:putative nucleotide binding protein|uniref:DUF655 domain-containing protein n=1 Tax=Acidilobus sp. TaxID=1872109 RepID=UPI003CFEAEFA
MAAPRGPPRRGEQQAEVSQVERKAIILDYMEAGYYLDPHRWHREKPVAQAIGESRFTLLDGIPLQPVEPLEEVAVTKEVLETVEEPLDPVGRHTRKVSIPMACINTGDSKRTCLPTAKVEQRLLDLLKVMAGDELEIVNSPAEFSRTLTNMGLPPKAIAAPRTPLTYESLTEIAKRNLREAVKFIIKANERVFIEFFNKAEPINIRLHSIELLRGVGKKTLMAILDARTKKPFESFDEIRKLIKDDPVEVLTDKVLEELEGRSKYNLFVMPSTSGVPFLDYLSVLEGARREGRK